MGYMMFPGEAKDFFENDYLSLNEGEKRAAQLEADIVMQKSIFENLSNTDAHISFDEEMHTDEIYICAHKMSNDANFKQKIMQQYAPVYKGEVDRKSYIAGIGMSRCLNERDKVNHASKEKQDNPDLSVKLASLKKHLGGR